MQQTTVSPTPKSNRRTWLLIGGALVAGCCVCAVLVYALGTPTSPSLATFTAPPAAQADSTEEPQGDATVEIIRPTQTEAPTEAPPTAVLGTSRDEPVPAGTLVDIGGEMQLAVLDVTRPANDLVQQFNQFNAEPDPGLEYMMVRLEVKCNKPANETCNFTTLEVKAVGSDGQVRDQAFVASVEDELQSTEFFGGNSIDGHMIFLVPEADPTAVLMFDPLFFGDPVYLELPS